jgi:aryl-alcohol dehydrogenase-like predicted oxidoreductase
LRRLQTDHLDLWEVHGMALNDLSVPRVGPEDVPVSGSATAEKNHDASGKLRGWNKLTSSTEPDTVELVR